MKKQEPFPYRQPIRPPLKPKADGIKQPQFDAARLWTVGKLASKLIQ